jgi:hypothetical protein
MKPTSVVSSQYTSIEFSKGKNVIKDTKELAELGELDTLIEQQAPFGRR